MGAVIGSSCAAVAWLAAAWHAVTAWRLASYDHGLVAFALVIAGTVIGTVALLLRVASPRVSGARDIALVFDGVHRLERGLRVIRVGRGMMGLICCAVVLYWIVEGFGMVNLVPLLIPSTILCFATACLYWPWLASRESSLREAHAAALARLKELKAAQLGP